MRIKSIKTLLIIICVQLTVAPAAPYIINHSDIARALSVSQPVIRDYLSIAHGTMIWRTIQSFTSDSTKRLIKHPKGHLRDSGLLHHLLRIPDLQSLQSHPDLGKSWESMVIEEILRDCNSKGLTYDYFYYRTGGGAEVDLILEGDFGRIPIEIKYSSRVTERDLRSITNFIKDYNCPYGIVVNNDETIRLYNEKCIGVPFNFL
jgi:predicted AAA+ superfamily ATPase